MGQILQPHYGHIPYNLQFMMDYNLQGMSLIHVKLAQFRHPEPKVTYESQEIPFWSESYKVIFMFGLIFVLLTQT